MKQRAWQIPLAVALAALLGWLGFVWQPATGPDARSAHLAQQGAGLPSGGPFTLDGPNGPVSLADYRGKVVLLYFGYTFCPDVCPTSLTTLAQALSALTPGELARVGGMLISVDPERDTVEVLRAYAPFFHPNIVGLTGTAQQVAQVAGQYGARYMKQKPDADGQYSVDHSSFIYVIASDGKLAASLPYGAPARDLLARVRSLLDPAS